MLALPYITGVLRMKTLSFLVLALAILMPVSYGAESSCQTDGCVSRKNAQTAAVINWINTNDDCTNAVSWLQSLKKLNDSQFQLICGDASETQEIILDVQMATDTDVIVKKIK